LNPDLTRAAANATARAEQDIAKVHEEQERQYPLITGPLNSDLTSAAANAAARAEQARVEANREQDSRYSPHSLGPLKPNLPSTINASTA